MVKDCIFTENIPGFFCADNGLSMDRGYCGGSPQTIRARSAIKRYRPDSTELLSYNYLPLSYHLHSMDHFIRRP